MGTPPDDILDVVVVVVTYNSADTLQGFLEELPGACDGIRWHLTVADNASTDGSPELVERRLPEATIVRMGRNAGYAAAINAAVDSSPASRTILVSNADIRPPRGCVVALLAQLDTLEAGIVGPRMVDEHGHLHLSVRREPSALRMLSDVVFGGTRPRRRLGGETVSDPTLYDTPHVCDWATGAFLLVDRRCHEALGGWDPRFFLYSEETDFGLRARDAGWAWWYVPSPTVTHFGGESGVSPRLYSILTVNKVRLVRARRGRSHALSFAAATALFELTRCLGGDRAVHLQALRSLLRAALPGNRRPDAILTA